MSRRDDLEECVAWTMKYCQHYDASGITMIGGKEPHGYCKAGVVYADQFPNPTPGQPQHYGIFARTCCTKGGERTEEEQIASCPKWLRATREQGEELFRQFAESDERFAKVMPVVAVWRKKPPRGKAEVIDCPACGGRLHLSQASVNGHVHGRCETKGCVSWME